MKKSQAKKKLKDISSRGKERKWNEYKDSSQSVARIFLDLAHRVEPDGPEAEYYSKRASLLQRCGDYLMFAVDSGNVKHLVGADFCRYRLCPMCAARRSRMFQLRLSRALQAFDLQKNRPAMLTLTVPDVPGDELRDTIKKMHHDFNTMLHSKKLKGAIIGFFRSTEVTRNKETGLYHPHMHVLVLFAENYFSDSDLYIDQRKHEWTGLWRNAQKTDSEHCIVHIEAVHGDLKKAVVEVTKYITKFGDLFQGVDQETAADILDTLDSQLSYLRFFGPGGAIRKELRRLYGSVSEDQIQPENPEFSEEDDIIIERYIWSRAERAYVLDKTLTLAEYRAYAESRRACSRKRRYKVEFTTGQLSFCFA